MSFETVHEAKQYCFDTAVRGLASQNWERCKIAKSNGGSTCAFNNGSPGVHCAMGWLIPEENQGCLDHTETPGQLRELGVFEPRFQTWLNTHYFDIHYFLAELMGAHDSSSKSMLEAFMDLGKLHNLTWPEEVPRA